MGNTNEEIIKKRYEQLDFTVVHKGAPDFLVFQRDEHGHMVNIAFVEVKRDIHDSLKDDQRLWKEALETLYCEYKLESPKNILQSFEYEKEFAKFYCRDCQKEIDVPRVHVYEELRRMRNVGKNLL